MSKCNKIDGNYKVIELVSLAKHTCSYFLIFTFLILNGGKAMLYIKRSQDTLAS